ncbi:Methylaspartate mutase E chain [Candidatus Izimaplasma bacterium HR1]|jgi:methylaspartate mutase epsilon subunit|nr:Methylaspartate mutase E chain [Candidatus Izimaplasma bacterium HR1]
MVQNKKMPLEEFLEIRKEVLRHWKTGTHPDLDLDRAVQKLKNLPKEKHFAHKLREAKAKGITLVQPRAGVARLDEHIELMQYLQDEGKADFLPSTIDSYTRHNRYSNAEDGIQESEKQGRSLLNGFPAVNHGVDGCSKVLDSVKVPLQARHGTPDARLLSEIIHASGWTSNEGGGISYNIPYCKKISLEDTIKYWQYCDRLVGYYQEHGVELNREPYGPLTGTLCPPCISNTVAIIESLLAAEQGVKNITVGYGQGGNLVQDIAALRALEEQTNHYLKIFGYKDVFVTTVFHQWMGGFPADESEAVALIGYASTVAALGKATKMITKTTHESFGIPTKEANAKGLKTSRYITNLLKDQKTPDSEELLDEIAQIKSEVDSLIRSVVKAGKGDIAQGSVKAFKDGIIDVPFAPSEINAGKILPARDIDGKIRILEFGNLGLTEEIKEFHHKKLQERADKQNRKKMEIQMVIDDIYAVSMGNLVGEKGE